MARVPRLCIFVTKTNPNFGTRKQMFSIYYCKISAREYRPWKENKEYTEGFWGFWVLPRCWPWLQYAHGAGLCSKLDHYWFCGAACTHWNHCMHIGASGVMELPRVWKWILNVWHMRQICVCPSEQNPSIAGHLKKSTFLNPSAVGLFHHVIWYDLCTPILRQHRIWSSGWSRILKCICWHLEVVVSFYFSLQSTRESCVHLSRMLFPSTDVRGWREAGRAVGSTKLIEVIPSCKWSFIIRIILLHHFGLCLVLNP